MEAADKNLYLDLEGRLICLSGTWEWEFLTDTVYCSTVMQFPEQLIAAKGLLHPDDKPAVIELVQAATNKQIPALQFRLITTYGAIKHITGSKLTIKEDGLPEESDPPSAIDTLLSEWEHQAAFERMGTTVAVSAVAEKLLRAGTWSINTGSFEINQSDNLFRIHGVMPQTLNAHVHTFSPFIHPDDHEIVSETFDKAYKSRIPLRISYRVVDALGQPKTFRLSTDWTYSDTGESILCALVQDVTEQQQLEDTLDHNIETLHLCEQQRQLSEQAGDVGSWQTNLFTRKSIFSDQYYRLLGLKPQAVPLQLDQVLNFVHAEDRERLATSFREISTQHHTADIEFRIMRKDGSVRYVHQKCKTVVWKNSELLVLGTIRDITLQKQMQARVRKLNAEVFLKNSMQQMLESTHETYTWIYASEADATTWSENFGSLMGYKTSHLQLTHKLFNSFIYHEDKKKYTDALSLLLKEKLESDLEIRLLVRGEVKRLKISLKVIRDEAIYWCLGIIQDETTRHAERQETETRRELGTNLAESISEAYFVTDGNHYIIDWNKNFAEQVAKSSLNHQQTHLFDVLPGLNEPTFMADLDHALHGKAIERKTKWPALAGGARKHKMIPIPHAGTFRVLHILENSHHEEQLVQKLSGYMLLLENLLESIEDQVVVMDRNMNYVYWNRACEMHYGISRKDVIGKNILELSPVFYDDPLYQAFKKALRGEIVRMANPAGEDYGPQKPTVLIPVNDASGQVVFLLWIGYAQRRENHAFC